MVCGQTHSLSTHRTYYDKSSRIRKRKLEEGSAIQGTFQKIFEENRKENESTTSSELPNFQDQEQIYSKLSLTVPPETMNRILDEAEFGLSRNDIDKVAKRYEWLDQEIDYLQHYISNIEPSLSNSQRKNRHATCLQHLYQAPREVKGWFHPFHIETSGRLKTGYEQALAKMI